VAVCHLFFCLAATCWLVAGVVFTAHQALSTRARNASLSQLARAAAAIEMDVIRHGRRHLQQLVCRTQSEGDFTYCAIVGADGKFLAHSNADQIGRTAVDISGDRVRRGDVEQVSYADERSQTVSEYRMPLTAKQECIGALRAGTVEPDRWGFVRQLGNTAPLAVFAPLLLIGVGAVVLSRQTRPLAKIEGHLRQIAQTPLAEPIDLAKHRPRTAAAIGWNRIAETIEQLRRNNPDDFNSRVAAMARHRQSEGAQSLLAHLPDGIAVTDAQGRIAQANPAMAALLGQGANREALIGSRVEEHLPGEETGQALAEFAAAENTQRSVIVELSHPIDDEERFFRVARYPLRQADGAPRGHLWNIRDITQQKLSDQMRDQFIGAATHELRTPLANIKAYAETLASMDEPDLESQKEFCNTINSEATRLARFVDDILSISSMEAGSLAVDRQAVETTRLLSEVVEKVEPLMKQKSLAFEVSMPAKLPELRVDKDKIVVTLVNLLGNAAKYTPDGGQVRLRVQTHDGQLQIDVEDSGFGIAADELPNVFEKFFRSSDARVLEQSGTGLGLALAREVIRLHGGDITATSEIDKGSTFSVMLPLSAR
jgi:PAS domain S-box-containing protein